MARSLRCVPPGGAMVEVTCRAIQGRTLPRPSALLNDVICGALARAARLQEVRVHGHGFLSNLDHLLVNVLDALQLAAFLNYLNSNLAREAGRLVRWREKFWGRRDQAILISDEEEAQVGRLTYLLAHGVKEGLVASPYDWLAVHCARDLVEGHPVSVRWHCRTLESKARRKGVCLEPNDFIVPEQLTLAPLPCWQSEEPEVYRARVQTLIEEIEASGKQRLEETGSGCLGFRLAPSPPPDAKPSANRVPLGIVEIVRTTRVRLPSTSRTLTCSIGATRLNSARVLLWLDGCRPGRAPRLEYRPFRHWLVDLESRGGIRLT